MEKYTSKDGNVIKYIHDNGAETVLKLGASCVNGKMQDKEKAVLFISSSVGCTEGCKFCYLTEKKYAYHQMSGAEILATAKEAIDASHELIKDRYIKFSFMGMGDCFRADFEIEKVGLTLFLHVMTSGLVKGIDGMDFGTSFPVNALTDRKLQSLIKLNQYLNHLVIGGWENPHNQYSDRPDPNHIKRTIVRLFISLPAITDDAKTFLMPRSSSYNQIVNAISCAKNEIDIIFHAIFLDGINDQDAEIALFHRHFVYNEGELRLLRYNQCPGSKFEESKKIEKIIDLFKGSNILFKYQQSPGSEILASCGQFICKMVK